MLTRAVRHLVPTSLRPRYDTRVLERRWRRGIIMEPSTEMANRLWADGYQWVWRIHDDIAIGHTLAGDRVTIPVEKFVARYFT